MGNLSGWAGWLLVICSGCGATVTHVRGPDGQDWIAIDCGGTITNCYESAGEECPSGYEIGDRSGAYGSISRSHQSGSYNGSFSGTATKNPMGYGVSGSENGSYSGTSTGVSEPVYKGTMLIQCKHGARGRTRAVAREEAQESAVSAEATTDYSQCNTALDHVDELAQVWSEWYGGEPSEHIGGDGTASHATFRGDFVRLCGRLDEDVQLCLVAAYAESHRDKCQATLKAMPSWARERIDGWLVAR